MRSTFILSVILIIVFSCKQDTEQAKDVIIAAEAISIPKQEVKPVYISGETDDSKAFENLNFLDYTNFYGGEPQGQHIEKDTNSIAISIDSMKRPKIMELMIFGNKFHNTRVFVTPGDSIKLVLKNDKIIFKGLHADHYNFYLELDSLTNEFSTIGFKDSFTDYKRRTNELYQKRNEFFEAYVKSHQVSEEFINQVRAEMKFEYMYNLIAPRTVSSSLPNVHINNSGSLTSVFENQNINLEDNFLDLKRYFDDIKIEDFNRPDLIDNDYFKRSLTSLIRNYFTQPEYVAYNEENFEAEIGYINKNLKGEIAQFAKARVIVDYFEKGFGQDKTTHARLKTEIDNFLKQKSNLSYIAAVKDIQEELKVFNFKIPKKILEEKLLTAQGDTIRFKDLIQSKKNSKFIVFWINKEKFHDDCIRCVDDLWKTQNLKKQLVDDSTEWIYISIAETKQWYQDLILFKNNLEGISNYKTLGNNMESKMLKYFKVKNINFSKENYIQLPRHLILDENNSVWYNAVPNVFDIETFKSLLKKEKSE
ncbi:hypothetical protein [Bizionia echini]|uniref:hypothetical protein n=1 Tax=Bizionia echini TaxID=649333 RepID=UPI0030D82E13